MTLTETLQRYAEYDRRWLAEHGDDCRRWNLCAERFPASVFAWCPSCREEMRRRKQAA